MVAGQWQNSTYVSSGTDAYFIIGLFVVIVIGVVIYNIRKK